MFCANSFGQRTFTSPGYGRLKSVASYQAQWFTVYGSSASGRCCLPLNIFAFATIQALAMGLCSVLPAVVTPMFSGTWFGRCVEGLEVRLGRLALDEGRGHRRGHEVELVHGRQTEDLFDRAGHVDLRVVGVVGGSVLHRIRAHDVTRTAMAVDVVDAVLRIVFLNEDRRDAQTLLWLM